MQKLVIIQPYLTEYRLPVFNELGKDFIICLISSSPERIGTFGDPRIDGTRIRKQYLLQEQQFFNGKLLFQSGVIAVLRKENPDVVLSVSNPRYLNFWLALFYCRIKNIPFFTWGHGLFKKKEPSVLSRFVFRIMVKFSKKYICYTSAVQNSLKNLGIPDWKIPIAENSLIFDFPVTPSERSGDELGVLFIGRLRPHSEIPKLIKAVEKLRNKTRTNVILHVVGDGEEGPTLQKEFGDYNWIIWYGEIYNQQKVAEISKKCFCGCYPGSAGLSILHMMSLSLPPVIHGSLYLHGPESSYISDNVNGLLFSLEAPEDSIQKCLFFLLTNKARRKEMQELAFSTYKKISEPNLGERLKRILIGW
ncbi:MAG: glycosyltransferase family 4 protein [Candidatus Ozemobacteraceae bacterium]